MRPFKFFVSTYQAFGEDNGAQTAAAGLSGQLQNILNNVFKVQSDPKLGVKGMVFTKLKNASLVVLANLLVIASLILSGIITASAAQAGHHSFPPAIIELLNNVVSLAVFVLLTFIIYKVLPGLKIPPRPTWIAAGGVALLFIISKFLLGFIIGRTAKASAYGAAVSVISLLVWFYYSGQILILGAEGLKTYAADKNLQLKPKKNFLKIEHLNMGVKSDVRGRLWLAFKKGFTAKKR